MCGDITPLNTRVLYSQCVSGKKKQQQCLQKEFYYVPENKPLLGPNFSTCNRYRHPVQTINKIDCFSICLPHIRRFDVCFLSQQVHPCETVASR